MIGLACLANPPEYLCGVVDVTRPPLCRFLPSSALCAGYKKGLNPPLFFVSSNVFVMRSRRGNRLKSFRRIQSRGVTMPFLYSLCARDPEKECKVEVGSNTCRECTRAQKSCDLLISDATCIIFVPAVLSFSLLIPRQGNVLRIRKINFVPILGIS